MTLEIRLSGNARKDIQSIADYTLGTWGEDQSTSYVGGLSDVFRKISENPGIGRPRPDLMVGLRSFKYQRHLVFYHPKDTFIIIAAVLHQSQDAPSHIGSSE